MTAPGYEIIPMDDGAVEVRHPDGQHRTRLEAGDLRSESALVLAEATLPPVMRRVLRSYLEDRVGLPTGGWGPLPDLRGPRPPEFPMDCLPECIAEPVGEIARFTQTPVEAVAGVVFGALSTAARGRFAVRVTGDYIESVSLYTVIAMPSGARKSEIFRRVMPALEAWERDAQERVAPLRAEKLAQRKALQKALDKAQRDGEDTTVAAAELAACVVPPVPRLLTDDTTMEKLEMLLAEQGGVMAIMAPEGSLFGITAGRYSRNGTASFDPLLKGWSGEALRVDRATREFVGVAAAHLTLTLMVQPSVLADVIGHPDYRGRGLLARILFLLPPDTIGTRTDEPDPIAPGVLAAWGDVLRRMLASTGHELTLDGNAYTAWRGYYTQTEHAMLAGGPLERLRDWGSKAGGQVVRLAALLHLARYAGREPLPVAIDGDTMCDAVMLGSYFREVARQLLTSEDARAQDARQLVAWLKRTRTTRVTVRELERHCGPKSWLPVIEDMVELGVMKELAGEPGRAGRPTRRWEVHPGLTADSADNALGTEVSVL